MKYLKNKIGLLALVATVSLFTSCKKGFLDINDNPNNPTDNNVPAELLFNQGAVGTAGRQASGNFRVINSWMGYLSSSGDFAIVQDETTYNIDFSFGNAIWANHYNVLFDLYQAKTKSLAKGDSVMAGACMILSAKLWQELVDIYGDIPYFEAFQNSVTRSPAYTPAQDVYADLQKVLDTAKTYMGQTARLNFNTYIGGVTKIGSEVRGSGDVPTKQDHWIKFANTLKLRMLIHQAEKPGFTPGAELAKISDGGAVFNILRQGETAYVNPGYVNDVSKQSPFFANYGLTPSGADANTSTRANQYIVGLLGSNSDPRQYRFFDTLSNGNVVGTTFGLSSGNPTGANSSKFGPGLVGSASQDQWLITSTESLFLEAEAIVRGWEPGNAELAYDTAIHESFVWLGVPFADSLAVVYRTDNPNADWANSGATVQDKVKFLAFQKYIAMTGIDPLESWTDLRRLGNFLPAGYISVNPSRISNTLPVRLLYPQTEYTTNAANVGAEGTINQFTSKIFWQP